MDFLEDILPIARLLLAEEAHGGVPGAVAAIEEPAPIGDVRKRDPDRHGEGTT